LKAAQRVHRFLGEQGKGRAQLAVREANRLWLKQCRDDSIHSLLSVGCVAAMLRMVLYGGISTEQAEKFSLDMVETLLKDGYKTGYLTPRLPINQCCRVTRGILSIRTRRKPNGTQDAPLAQSEQDPRKALPNQVSWKTTGYKRPAHEASDRTGDLQVPPAKKACRAPEATRHRARSSFDVYSADVDRALMQ